MKKLLFLLLLLPFVSNGQDTLAKVGTGEYNISYVSTTGRLYMTVYGQLAGVSRDTTIKVPTVRNVTDINGAQYTSVIIEDDTVAVVFKDNNNAGFYGVIKYPTDSAGVRFSGATKVYGWFQTWLAIKNDSLWYWGADGTSYGALQLKGSGASPILKPFKLGQPTGRHISKVITGNQDTPSFIVLCTDGTVWTYTRGSATPVQKSGLSSVLDIGGVGRACFVAATATDLLGWGQFSDYVGLPSNTTTPTSILSRFTAQGLVMPIKEMGNNWNVFAVIDANDTLFTMGDNMQGEVGNGQEYTPYKTYKNGTSNAPFAWDQGRGQKMVLTPYKHRGKFHNLQSTGNIAFYFYVQGSHNEWYSWGRNKATVLGNGLEKTNMDTYPEWGNVPAPRSVAPLTGVKWPASGGGAFVPTANLAPVANAGVDRDVTTSSDSLYGDLSFQQEQTISSYVWSQLSGPNSANIAAPTSANTAVTGMISGIYIFVNTVTNSNNLTNKDTVVLYVTVNTPPTASAGTDQIMYLPTTTTTLTGSGAGTGGATISSYAWTQTSGTAASITSPSSATTGITGLTTAGVRVFHLVVTDNHGLTATSNVTVTVNARPTANAGTDQVVNLPIPSGVTLTGVTSISSPTVIWSKVSGPSTYTIVSPNALSTNVTDLVQGTYLFELHTSGSNGQDAKDTMQVIANTPPTVTIAPTSVSLVSPTSSTSLTATGVDVDGTITGYAWVKISGTGGTIVSPTAATTSITGLSVGSYVYRVTVTDNWGATGTADVSIVVHASTPTGTQQYFRSRVRPIKNN